jgi:hypothetical protein
MYIVHPFATHLRCNCRKNEDSRFFNNKWVFTAGLSYVRLPECMQLARDAGVDIDFDAVMKSRYC